MIPITKHDFGQDYGQSFKKMNTRPKYSYGDFQNRKRKPRQFRYLYNNQHKRRSKISKTQNLRVELHAPTDIQVGKPFKLKCLVSGSLAEAVDIIWDNDSSKHENMD